MATFTLTVNGKRSTMSVNPDTPLLYALRNDLLLNGPKFGCGLAQCGWTRHDRHRQDRARTGGRHRARTDRGR
jgi:hypothetical protein